MLYLVRHAHTDWNSPRRRFQGRADTVLSTAGRAEAQAMGRAAPEVDVVVSSPAARCLETARLLFPNHEPERDERICEIDVGRFEGAFETDVAASMPDLYAAWRDAPHLCRIGGTGETLLELSARVFAALVDCRDRARQSGKRICIVTHGGPIRALTCLLGRRPLADFHRIAVENLAFFAVDLDLSRIDALARR